MILQRLAEHYDRIAASGDDNNQIVPPGFSQQKISFCVVLESDGRLNAVQSMQQQKGRVLVATRMLFRDRENQADQDQIRASYGITLHTCSGTKRKTQIRLLRESNSRRSAISTLVWKERSRIHRSKLYVRSCDAWTPDKALEIDEEHCEDNHQHRRVSYCG